MSETFKIYFHKHVALDKQDVTQKHRGLIRCMCVAFHVVSFYHIILKTKYWIFLYRITSAQITNLFDNYEMLQYYHHPD